MLHSELKKMSKMFLHVLVTIGIFIERVVDGLALKACGLKLCLEALFSIQASEKCFKL